MSEINSSGSINLYNEKYFLEAVDGFREYSEFNGEFLSLFDRYQRNVNLMKLMPGHKYLEFGCGRGEICIYHALQGGTATGVDYSADAINLAIEKAKSLGAQVGFVVSSFADFKALENHYDRILASEFIEHISAAEGYKFVEIAYKSLRPGGRVLIFTHPNTIQRRFGYPLVRLFNRLQGVILPKKQSDTLDEHYRLYHLNEQNYFSLKKMINAFGFKYIEVGYDVDFSKTNGFFKKLAFKIIKNTFLRHLFLTNLYVVAEK
ncbi:class I SAM-dependent methyltransferase [Azonexus hydrophilus]|uniref:class I SAM-dependent methyltransferase n=1 Tax=Azonexus hydrophilus TaxID=418702 RepID=UPI00196546A7|nr:class I SAM-dependent methyltransferase [Azonexus hydrophilus]